MSVEKVEKRCWRRRKKRKAGKYASVVGYWSQKVLV